MERTDKKLAVILVIALICAGVLGIVFSGMAADEKSTGSYQIRFSEVCAKNETILAANDGQYHDYVELYNAGTDINLEGFTLTDGEGSFCFGSFPLSEGEYRVIFLNRELTGFALSASGGETIQLKDPSGGIVTQITLPAIPADHAMSYRGGIYTTSTDATPGFSNDNRGLNAFREGTPCNAPNLVISEMLTENVSVCPDEKGTYSDIIELRNLSGEDILLRGYCLSDDPGQRFRFRLPDVTLQAGGYLAIFCDGENYIGENGEIHTNFALSVGETLCLTDSSGAYLTMDAAFPGEDISFVRADEGSFTAAAPSPGWPNTSEGIDAFLLSRQASDSALVISEVLLSSSGVAFEANLQDVAEITNISDSPVSTLGWYLSDGGDPYEYPLPEATLQPGESILVICSQGTTGFSLSQGETLFLTTPDYRFTAVSLLDEEQTGCSISRQTEGYACTAPSLGYPNNAPGQEAYALATMPVGLRISEAMSANTRYLLSAYGVSGDWVELYNGGSTPVTLSDFCLTDDPKELQKCPLPQLTLKPGEYCVIFLSEDAAKLLPYRPAVPLSLSSAGDTLYLTKNGIVEDHTVLPALQVNTAWGRAPGSGLFTQLANATPNEENAPAAQRCEIPRAMTEQGVYDDVEYVDVVLAGEGTIYYTTDCTQPDANSTLYTGPIRLTETTVIRAVCCQPGKTDSPVLDLTYIINEYDHLSVVSLVLEHDDLWSDATGIYANGPVHQGAFPYLGANFWQDWEKPATLSLFEAEGGGFCVPCGTKIFGNYSRGLEMKSFSCFFRDNYGTSALNYPLFGDEGLPYYESLVLRCSGQDAIRAKMRDVVITSLAAEATGLVVQKYKPAVLYLNGEYWGLYYIREKISEQFIAGYYNVRPEDVVLAEGQGRTCPEYEELYQFVRGKDMSDPANFARVQEMMDVEQYTDWVITQICIANTDPANIKFFKAGDGKWTWILYDTDLGFRKRYEDTVSSLLNRDGATFLPTVLAIELLDNPDYREFFLTRFAWHLNNIWTEENIIARVDEIEKLIGPDMVKDCARWGRFTPAGWHDEVEVLRNFARVRKDAVTAYVMDYFGLTPEQMRSYGFDI